MTKCILLLLSMSLILSEVIAQKGRNQLNMAVETTLPFYQNDRGFGVFMKGLYGIGKSAQLTLTTGVARFRSKISVEQTAITTRLIPVLAGYKKNFKKIFIEPQIGYGELGGKIQIGGDHARPSVGAFFWAVGAGFDHKRITIGLRFQQTNGIESTSAGIWHNKDFHYTAIQLGYKLF
jgi:hypothetical protein